MKIIKKKNYKRIKKDERKNEEIIFKRDREMIESVGKYKWKRR